MMKKIYIVLFSLLYLCIAVISCIHAFEFFGLANSEIMAAVLSGAFEVGQAAVLFALLTSEKERGKIMPWVLMVIFTLVQIMGNIYACYKYIMTNSQELLRYFKEPIFIWTNLPDAQATVIVTYIVAAILPICGLLLTSMVTNFLDKEKPKEEEKKEEQEEIKKKIEEPKSKEVVEEKIEDVIEKENEEAKIEEDNNEEIEDNKEEIEENEEDIDDLMTGSNIKQDNLSNYSTTQKSHFVNI